MMSSPTNVTPIEKFGKDHLSLLAYVASRCAEDTDGRGVLERGRMRCNTQNHRLQARQYHHGDLWNERDSTRLAGFADFPDRKDPEKVITAGFQLRGHDDWDCLADLEAAGLVKVLTLVNNYVRLTEKGHEIADKAIDASEVPELDAEFFTDAIHSQPGGSLIEKIRASRLGLPPAPETPSPLQDDPTESPRQRGG